MPLRSQLSRRGKLSIKARIGTKGLVTAQTRLGGGSGIRTQAKGSIKSRLGNKKPGPGGVRGQTGSPRITAITDARQKINLNRVKTGRIGDAREKIEIRRLNKRGSPGQHGGFKSTRGGGGGLHGVQTLKITTLNTPPPPPGAGLFANALSDMGSRPSSWEFQSAQSRTYFTEPRRASPPRMLTRTVPNNSLTSSASRFGRPAGGGMYSNSITSPLASRTRSAGRFRDESDDDMDMEMEVEATPIRASLAARLDTPSRFFKIIVSNLKNSVTSDDIRELFADVGDLVSSKMIGSGQAEIYYKSKQDCLNAIEAYNTRLLDGSPMKVVMVEDNGNLRGGTTGLKSAAGASIKIPKSSTSNSLKIQPDISAIHKVLFQPTSSSATTSKMFKFKPT